LATRLTVDERAWAQEHFTAANYLAAAMIYLKDNELLEKPLKGEHIKDALLGHWGTCPGLNILQTHLSLLAKKRSQSTLLITGPGHGFASFLANSFIDGSLEPYYSELTPDNAGTRNLIKAFCWPSGFPSHLNPGVPGCIHEGGELGYALGVAFGAAFDNPDLMVACIVGDGEAETGPTAAAWHSTKWLDPKKDGAVLPIIHLNHYKISNPTIYSTMSKAELTALFTGYGYAPKFVGPDHDKLHAAIFWAHDRIRAIQHAARSGKPNARPRWPVIIFESPKGMTGIPKLGKDQITGTWRSHQVPAKDAKANPESLAALEHWLRSYKPDHIFTADWATRLRRHLPEGPLRIASNPHAIGGNLRKALELPAPEEFQVAIHKRGHDRAGSTPVFGQFLTWTVRMNKNNFRIYSPDELASNKLDAVLAATSRAYTWPHDKADASLAPGGQVMEILSEHTLQAWMQGYLLTGRHGLFPSYEAFLPIVDSMVSQYLKFIEMSIAYPWRTPVSSMNYLLTSVCWRQDHNGFSHQNPGFINTLLNKAKEEQLVRIYLPADANMTLTVADHCLRSTNRVNVIVADKQPNRQWLTYQEARDQARTGAGIWPFASVDDPDVILCGIGDYQVQECLAAIMLLRHIAPEVKVRFVNVSELNVMGPAPFYPNGMDEGRFQQLFPVDRTTLISFHGYPGAVKQLLFDRPANSRFRVYGYIEKGTTTTPFDMLVRNNVSRYDLARRCIEHAAHRNHVLAPHAHLLVARIEKDLLAHQAYILEHGRDPPEIAEWTWHDVAHPAAHR